VFTYSYYNWICFSFQYKFNYNSFFSHLLSFNITNCFKITKKNVNLRGVLVWEWERTKNERPVLLRRIKKQATKFKKIKSVARPFLCNFTSQIFTNLFHSFAVLLVCRHSFKDWNQRIFFIIFFVVITVGFWTAHQNRQKKNSFNFVCAFVRLLNV